MQQQQETFVSKNASMTQLAKTNPVNLFSQYTPEALREIFHYLVIETHWIKQVKKYVPIETSDN